MIDFKDDVDCLKFDFDCSCKCFNMRLVSDYPFCMWQLEKQGMRNRMGMGMGMGMGTGLCVKSCRGRDQTTALVEILFTNISRDDSG